MVQIGPLQIVQSRCCSSTISSLAVTIWPILVVLGGAGCGRTPPRIKSPEWEPAAIASAAIEQLDANSDGSISRKECEEAPGLLFGFAQVDLDGDDQISASELEARFELYRNMGTGLSSQALRVTWKRRPLANVDIRLVPEPFQGGVIEAAEGTTDEMGVVMPRTEGQDVAAVRTGYYSVEIASLAGGERPKTRLGVEVSPVSDGPGSSGMIELRFQ